MTPAAVAATTDSGSPRKPDLVTFVNMRVDIAIAAVDTGLVAAPIFLADLCPEHVDVRAMPQIELNADARCDVPFDGLFVPAEKVVDLVHGNFRTNLDCLNLERVLYASEAIGLGPPLHRAVRYAKDRVRFRQVGLNEGTQIHSPTPTCSCGAP